MSLRYLSGVQEPLRRRMSRIFSMVSLSRMSTSANLASQPCTPKPRITIAKLSFSSTSSAIGLQAFIRNVLRCASPVPEPRLPDSMTPACAGGTP